MAVWRCGVGIKRSLRSMVSLELLLFGLSSLAGLSEKWHSDSLRRWMQIVHGCSPLHFCFLRLQLSQARLQRSRPPGGGFALGMMVHETDIASDDPGP